VYFIFQKPLSHNFIKNQKGGGKFIEYIFFIFIFWQCSHFL